MKGKKFAFNQKVRTKAVCFARNCDFLRPLRVWHCLAFLKSVSQSWRRSASWLGKICIVRTVHAPVSPSTSHFLLPLAQEMLCCFPPLLLQHSGHKFNFPAMLFPKSHISSMLVDGWISVVCDGNKQQARLTLQPPYCHEHHSLWQLYDVWSFNVEIPHIIHKCYVRQKTAGSIVSFFLGNMPGTTYFI